MNDIGSHVITDDSLGQRNSYADIPALLFNNNIIDKELYEAWILMVGFLNILVHGYTKLDRTIVYDVLQNKLDDLERISCAFAKLLP